MSYDEDIQREYVAEIREKLGHFNYDPVPTDYSNKKRIRKQQEQLENGARYEGEWDEYGQKDGQG